MAPMSARIVYSTGVGVLCPNCRRAARDCVCPKGAPGCGRSDRGAGGTRDQGPRRQGRHDRQRLAAAAAEIEALATKLKKRCGSGGTVRDGVIRQIGLAREEIRRLGEWCIMLPSR
jgi:translation initiation factor 1